MINKPVAFDSAFESTPPPKATGESPLTSGRIKEGDLARIRRHQLITNSNFEESAFALGLLFKEDGKPAISVPDFKMDQGREGWSPELVCAKAPDHPLAKAVYRMRTSLFLSHCDKPGAMIIAIAGAQRFEGRTVLAANLAIAFAQVGVRTTLLDADLRHGKIHELFNLKNRSGFADVLLDRHHAQENTAVMESDVLTVMTCGHCQRPERLLSPARIQGVLERVCEGREVVIVDTPSWSSGSDAELIAAQAGTTLLLVRLKTASLGAVTRMAKALERSGTKTMAVPLQ